LHSKLDTTNLPYGLETVPDAFLPTLHYRGEPMKPHRTRLLASAIVLCVVASGVLAFAVESEDGKTKDVKSKDAAIREFDLKTIGALGRQIFEQDGYASRATDILFDKIGGPEELTKQKIRGWIVVKQGRSVVVRFAKKDGDGLRPAYDITFDSPKKGVLKVAEDKTYPESEMAQFKARQLAIRSIPKLYSRSYNTTVLPDPAGMGFLVYALAASTDEGKIIVGGHYRFSISETGQKVLRIDPLFKSFLVIDKKELADRAKKEEVEPAGYFVTNLVSELPLETHVFLSLLHEMPFIVTTPSGKIWVVDGDAIKKIEDEKEGEKKGSPRK
jgi:hypothetical protein